MGDAPRRIRLKLEGDGTPLGYRLFDVETGAYVPIASAKVGSDGQRSSAYVEVRLVDVDIDIRGNTLRGSPENTGPAEHTA